MMGLLLGVRACVNWLGGGPREAHGFGVSSEYKFECLAKRRNFELEAVLRSPPNRLMLEANSSSLSLIRIVLTMDRPKV